MTEKFYVDSSGNYLGSYSGYNQNVPILDENGNPILGQDGEPLYNVVYVDATPPEGGIEVPINPQDGRQKWDFVNEVWLPLEEQYLPPKRVKSITADYTTVPFNSVILADCTEGDIEITAVEPMDKQLTIKKVDTSNNIVTLKSVVDGIQDFIIDRPMSAYTFAYSDNQFFITGVV